MKETPREIPVLIPGHEYDGGWVWQGLVETAEEKGIKVYITGGLNGCAIRGMLYAAPPAKAVIAVAEDMEPEKKAFTLAHEVAHFMLGHLHDDATLERFLVRRGKQDPWEEEKANRFAKVLLAQVREEGYRCRKDAVTVRGPSTSERMASG